MDCLFLFDHPRQKIPSQSSVWECFYYCQLHQLNFIITNYERIVGFFSWFNPCTLLKILYIIWYSQGNMTSKCACKSRIMLYCNPYYHQILDSIFLIFMIWDHAPQYTLIKRLDLIFVKSFLIGNTITVTRWRTNIQKKHNNYKEVGIVIPCVHEVSMF